MRRRADRDSVELVVHYLDVVGAIGRDAHAAAHPEAVWEYDCLAKAAAALGLTELELVTEARRQALEALERRTTEHARANTQGLIDELEERLARHAV
jgi:hypothetical protein